MRLRCDPADVDEANGPARPLRPTCSGSPATRPGRWPTARREPGEIVLAADTTVVANGEILAKPADESDAIRMLQRCWRGPTHRVFTGVVAISGGRELAEVVETRVRLLPLEHRTKSSGTWERASPWGRPAPTRFRAGRPALWTGFDGSWSNVVGLPVATVDSDDQAVLEGKIPPYVIRKPSRSP